MWWGWRFFWVSWRVGRVRDDDRDEDCRGSGGHKLRYRKHRRSDDWAHEQADQPDSEILADTRYSS